MMKIVLRTGASLRVPLRTKWSAIKHHCVKNSLLLFIDAESTLLQNYKKIAYYFKGFMISFHAHNKFITLKYSKFRSFY